jgi:release factor glutamine methyltransferase
VNLPLRELVDAAARQLQAAGIDQPRLEAQLLAQRALHIDRAALLAHPELLVEPSEMSQFHQLIERRARREPFAYLTGEREFFGRPFRIDRRALIPRPETELLIEEAVSVLSAVPGSPRMVDVGTGSGCIAITLALEVPAASIFAVDLSTDALALASENVQRYGLEGRVHLLVGSLIDWLRRGADLLSPTYRTYQPRASSSWHLRFATSSRGWRSMVVRVERN